MCRPTERSNGKVPAFAMKSTDGGVRKGEGEPNVAGPLVAGTMTSVSEQALVYMLRSMTALDCDIRTAYKLHQGTSRGTVLAVPDLFEFMTRVMTRGEIGLGEAYADGVWWMERGSLAEMLTDLGRNSNNDSWVQFVKNLFPSEWLRKWRETFRNMGADQQKDLIKVAYDVDDTLYHAMLDRSMTYTSARFLSGDETLEEAQFNKRKMMIEKARLPSDARVVDIGCGWGGLCAHVADHTPGATVTGVSNSPGMVRIATERNGKRHNIDYRECDYRDIDIPDGTVDAILSCEMVEAIGVNQFDAFAAVCERLLKPGGRAVIQVITAPAWSNAVARTKVKRNETFVTTYIFPGGQIPHVEFMEEAMAPHFDRVHSESFGHDYARTLYHWRKNLLENQGSVKCTDKIKRGYDYYLAWCEAGFSTELLNIHQLVFQKRGPKPTLARGG